MKTPMTSFLGSPLLNSNMLQTLFPTSIPLIRTNLALYLLYDFSCLPFSFRLLRFFARDIFFLWLSLIIQDSHLYSFYGSLFCLRHFYISVFFHFFSSFLFICLVPRT